jgi:hypothetical protein
MINTVATISLLVTTSPSITGAMNTLATNVREPNGATTLCAPNPSAVKSKMEPRIVIDNPPIQ